MSPPDEAATKAKSPASSRVEMAQHVFPGQANSRGTAFGGQILAWIDIAAGISAGRFAEGPVVTASMDDVHFLRPIRVGDVVLLKAQVNFVGCSSMEVGVRVEGEAWGGGEKSRYHALSAYTTFVALDQTGRPRPVPRLTLETDEDRRHADEGQRRMGDRRMRRSERGRRLEPSGVGD